MNILDSKFLKNNKWMTQVIEKRNLRKEKREDFDFTSHTLTEDYVRAIHCTSHTFMGKQYTPVQANNTHAHRQSVCTWTNDVYHLYPQIMNNINLQIIQTTKMRC